MADPAAREQRRHLVVHLRAVLREQLARMAAADQLHERVVGLQPRPRLVACDHLDLAAAQAGGDLEPLEAGDLLPRPPAASRRSRTPAGRTGASCPARTRCAPRWPPGTRAWTPPRPTSPGARAAGPGGPRPSACPGTTTPGAVPTGSITYAPSGTSACLRLAARTASKSQWRKRCIRPRRMSAIRSSSASSSTERPAREARHHLHGHVVGGRAEAAARDDQVHVLVGHEAQLGLHVLGAVAGDRDVGQLDRRARAGGRRARGRCGR